MTIAPASPQATRRVLIRGGEIGPPNMGGLWPNMGTLGGAYVYDAQSARRIPAVQRALQLIAGLVRQMPMESYRGYQRLAQPHLLAKPDPLRGGPEFVGLSVEDYLLSGNAIARITVRGADGWPLACQWLPAQWTYILWNVGEPLPTYYYLNSAIPFEDVIHVRRSADRFYPVRGVGVVEEQLGTLDRVAMEEEYERNALADGAVPSVAVVTPSATLTQQSADEAKLNWATKFGGPTREPVFLPNGTQVIPLAWSPTDTQLAEARRLSLIDVANMFNLDSYWLGGEPSGLTYKSPGPQYLQILRTSLEPILSDFEAIWSDAWLPRGTGVRFQRAQLLREDLATSTTAAVAAFGASIITLPEARIMIGLPPNEVGAPGTPATPDDGDPSAALPGDDEGDALPEGEEDT